MNDGAIFSGIDHFGINSETTSDALKNAKTLNELFNLQLSDGKDSIYAGPAVELMKHGIGRGLHGHVAVGTTDINTAIAYLEKKGIEFDHDSCKYDNYGRLIVIYLKQEIAGFAIHLLQK